jgi:hypothetical protein
MEGSPDQITNEEMGYKSKDLAKGEAPVSKVWKSDKKLQK